MTTLLTKLVGNVVLVYLLDNLVPQYFSVFGNFTAFLVLGALMTLLNVIVRPLLALVTAPLHFLFSGLVDKIGW